MKPNVINVFTIFSSIVFFSCNVIVGDLEDSIKLSEKNFEFCAASDSVSITTEGTTWWINNVSVDGGSYFNFTEITAGVDTYKICKYCYTLERRNENSLVIQLNKNPGKIDRKVIVCLQDGNYFDYIHIIQKAE